MQAELPVEVEAHKPLKMHPFSSFLVHFQLPLLFSENFQHLHVFLSLILSSLAKHAMDFMKRSYWFLVFQSNPLIAQLMYFMSISFAGFLALKNLQPRHNKPMSPRDLDLFFTSVSTVTVSSMATVEMAEFSDLQLWVLILLMLLGGEVFTSMLGLHFKKARVNKQGSIRRNLASISRDIESSNTTNDGDQKTTSYIQVQQSENMKQTSLTILAYIVAGYFVAAIVCSSAVIMIYLWIGSDATRHLLQSRGIKMCTFSIFTAVSSFANCGFIPVNENMAIFRKDSVLLLLVIPQILAGNTLFPSLLRLSIWALGKAGKREKYGYLLRHPEKTGYRHLHSQKDSVYMALTVAGFILLQMMFLCSLKWDSEALQGMSWFQKLVASLFQSVNTRHAGESVIDISTLSPPLLVLFAFMMYLPSNTSFLPVNDGDQPSTNEKENCNRRTIWKNFIIPKPAYLAMLVIMACITERKSMSADPLNFNIFSIVFEVISAHGNVGYSLGYSCKKLLKPDTTCKAASYGFVGRWSDEGRVIIILVMFLGRLKRFSLNRIKAWKFL